MSKDKIIFITASFLLILVIVVGVNVYGADVFFKGVKETEKVEEKEDPEIDEYANTYLKNIDKFKGINKENIISIEKDKIDDEGKKTALIEDTETITKIYDMLSSLYIEVVCSECTNTNSITYKLLMQDNKEYIFEFSNGKIVIGNKNYSTVGVTELDFIKYDIEV